MEWSIGFWLIIFRGEGLKAVAVIEARSSKIDIATQTLFIRSPQELEKMRTFSLPRTATKQNDQSGKVALGIKRLFSEGEKMTAIATDNGCLPRLRMVERLLIRGRNGQDFFQLEDLMAPKAEQMRDFNRHIVIEKELHAPGAAICSATNASISVR